MNICLILFIRLDQGVNLDHINVIELQRLFDLVLVGLTSTTSRSVLLSSVFFMADPVVRGLDDGIGVKLVSPEGTLLRIFGMSSEPQCLGHSEGK